MALRVLVVDDSAVVRAVLIDVLECDGTIKVVGEAGDGAEALSMCEALAPDVVTMDVNMPGVNGADTIAALMARSPLPIVVVTGDPAGDEGDVLVAKALEAGAAEVVLKPAFTDEKARRELRAVVHAVGAGWSANVVSIPDAETEMIAIAVGLGSTRSLAAYLERLPLAASVVVALPIPSTLARVYARYLQSKTRLEVLLPEGASVTPTKGTVTLLADKPWRCVPGSTLVPAVSGPVLVSEVPADVPRESALFESIASVCGTRARGVVLAGTGEDRVVSIEQLVAHVAQGAPTP